MACGVMYVLKKECRFQKFTSVGAKCKKRDLILNHSKYDEKYTSLNYIYNTHTDTFKYVGTVRNFM